MPNLHNKEVQLVITPKETEKEEKEETDFSSENKEYQPVSEFGKFCYALRNCRPTKEEEEKEDEYDRLRYEYLMEKYK
jgi:hypothetical protein